MHILNPLHGERIRYVGMAAKQRVVVDDGYQHVGWVTAVKDEDGLNLRIAFRPSGVLIEVSRGDRSHGCPETKELSTK